MKKIILNERATEYDADTMELIQSGKIAPDDEFEMLPESADVNLDSQTSPVDKEDIEIISRVVF